jgi:hypothetical protein
MTTFDSQKHNQTLISTQNLILISVFCCLFLFIVLLIIVFCVVRKIYIRKMRPLIPENSCWPFKYPNLSVSLDNVPTQASGLYKKSKAAQQISSPQLYHTFPKHLMLQQQDSAMTSHSGFSSNSYLI